MINLHLEKKTLNQFNSTILCQKFHKYTKSTSGNNLLPYSDRVLKLTQRCFNVQYNRA